MSPRSIGQRTLTTGAESYPHGFEQEREGKEDDKNRYKVAESR